MSRNPEDLERAAKASGAHLLSTELVQLKDGSWELAGKFGFDDPWAAARLLCILAEEDGADPSPEVAAWSAAILDATARELGLPASDPAVHDAFVAAVHGNVQRWIRFEPEEGERFQSARTTMIEGVGDCDCHARLCHALARAQGASSEIRFFEANGEPVHAVAAFQTSYGPAWAETTIGAMFGEHPQDAYRRLGLDDQGARPDIGGALDDVAKVQHAVSELELGTALVVEQCAALADAQRATWDDLAKRVLKYVSTEPATATVETGQSLLAEIKAFGLTLEALGCKAPAPVPLPYETPTENQLAAALDKIAGPIKALAIVVGVVAGAVVVVKVADVVKSRRAA